MSSRALLVLGGIGSGRSEYAESVVRGTAEVRRLRAGPGEHLATLAGLLAEAKPDQTMLVEDLAGWLAGSEPSIEPLAAAVRDCPAKLVLVSAEVGLSTTPTTAANRSHADALGALNRAVAAAADAVVLVVAGQPVGLKGVPVQAGAPVAEAPAEPAGPAPDLTDLKGLAAPDEQAKRAATDRLARLGPISLGELAGIVGFAAATQGAPVPAPWRRVRVLVLHGNHPGAAGAGGPGADRLARQLRDGTSPLAQLAAPVGAQLRLVETAPADPIEDGPAMAEEAVEEALARGWQLAEQAADEGVDALVIGGIGDGADAAAAAVTALLAPGSEPVSLLPRVLAPDGTIDDPAWMRRCAAVRDAVHRTRSAARSGGRAALAALGGPDLAVAAGVLLGAAARRTPVLLDGPVGAAAGLVARNLAAPARLWWLLPDHGQHPTAARASEVLGLTPLLDLRLGLGEGACALAALPLLNTALTLAASLPHAEPGAEESAEAEQPVEAAEPAEPANTDQPGEAEQPTEAEQPNEASASMG